MNTSTTIAPSKTKDVSIRGTCPPHFDDILTPEALGFLKSLHLNFNERRKALLEEREKRQARIDAGIMPDFLPETASIRERNWQVAPLPPDLMDRRVEITGPVDRKMIINALNSGAKIFMADFEDSTSPSWQNIIEGQINLRDAILRRIEYTHPGTGKEYRLNDRVATLMVRPRGWHLWEKNLYCEGEPMSASLVDFGLYFFHNASTLLHKGSGPYFYLPKLESHLEARLWNDVFVFAQERLMIPQKTIKATVLIETILASFELDEILYELRDHSAGLNCGRWDYIFSYIKKLCNLPGHILPDRSQVGMSAPCMSAYSLAVIQTCHRRGVHAMGGMAAQIPIKSDLEANDIALNKVRQDKLREVKNGHDGTWVAHPALVGIAMEVFDQYMPGPNQIHVKRADVLTTAGGLLEVPKGTITEAGMRLNINVGIRYLESWLKGNGAAAINHLMEDAATAEISRSQLWQWINGQARLADGRLITLNLYRALLHEEVDQIKKERQQSEVLDQAIRLFDDLVTADYFTEFLTIPAYNLI